MKALTQAWELIQLLSSLHFLSPTLVRAANPQNYTLSCIYSEEEVQNRDKLEGSAYIKHIITCRSSSCDYYWRLSRNFKSKDTAETAGAAAVGTMAIVGLIVTEITVPFTFGLSLLVFGTFLTAGGLIGGDLLIENNIKKNVKEVENELKEKWEEEQRLNAERNN
jgi:hypothetical protein